MTKARLRRELGARRRRVAPEEAEAAAESCRQTLLGLESTARAARIALYTALPGEIGEMWG